MTRAVKLRRAGGSISATLPGDMAERLHLAAGDTVPAVGTERGILLTPCDPQTEEALARGAEVSGEYRNALREPARQPVQGILRQPRRVDRPLVEALHLDLIRAHGGMPGLRDEHALESALARPRQRYAHEPSVDLAGPAAAHAHALARDHPFNDGDKRIGLVTMAVFPALNGRDIAAPEAEVVTVMLALAAGELDQAQRAAWLRPRIVPRSDARPD